MTENSDERSVRKNLTLPPSFIQRLEALKIKQGGASDSEVIRKAIRVLEALSDPNCEIILRNKDDGTEKTIVII